MPAGLQVFDSSGRITLDLTDRITRIVATITVPVGASGTIQLPEGTPWWYTTPNNAAVSAGSAYSPSISVNANNLLSYGPNTTFGSGQVECTLVAGVY